LSSGAPARTKSVSIDGFIFGSRAKSYRPALVMRNEFAMD